MNFNIEDLLAETKKVSPNMGRKRLMTEEELGAIRELRQRGQTISAIYKVFKSKGLTKYASELSFRNATSSLLTSPNSPRKERVLTRRHHGCRRVFYLTTRRFDSRI